MQYSIDLKGIWLPGRVCIWRFDWCGTVGIAVHAEITVVSQGSPGRGAVLLIATNPGSNGPDKIPEIGNHTQMHEMPHSTVCDVMSCLVDLNVVPSDDISRLYFLDLDVVLSGIF